MDIYIYIYIYIYIVIIIGSFFYLMVNIGYLIELAYFLFMFD